jgi:two-component system alkaline phosphatase synthesis response regulator PhoP/two-component system response regulator VicR
MDRDMVLTMFKHVLVVDDERHITRLVEVNLQRQGHTVSIAASPIRAIAEIERQRPDVVILDSLLADHSELRSRLKSDPKYSSIQVISLTPHRGQSRRFDHDDNDIDPGEMSQ